VGFGVSTGEGRRQRLGGWMGKFFTRWELASALAFSDYCCVGRG